MSEFIHNVPGRLRVKIPNIKNEQNKEKELIARLAGHEGIGKISINRVTGSVTIKYDPELAHPWEILGLLKINGTLTESRFKISNHGAENNGGNTGEAIGKAVYGWAIGKAFENSAVSFLAAFI